MYADLIWRYDFVYCLFFVIRRLHVAIVFVIRRGFVILLSSRQRLLLYVQFITKKFHIIFKICKN